MNAGCRSAGEGVSWTWLGGDGGSSFAVQSRDDGCDRTSLDSLFRARRSLKGNLSSTKRTLGVVWMILVVRSSTSQALD